MQSQFASQPHAAPSKRKAYRDDEEGEVFNLMNDPRVVRGSTFAPKVLTQKTKQDMLMRTKTVSTRKQFAVTKRSATPPPVEGRVHMDLQTEDFLDELTDKPVECDASTQTQAILDRPASPLFIRAKTGKDVETEILPDELFDFDIEVFPILEVLVSKTLHVSMLEVMQEEELEMIKRQQKEFEAIRNVELVEVQRLEAEEKRKLQEKEKRLDQERKRLNDRKQLENKIAARCFAQQYLTSLHTDVFGILESQGVFFDPVKKEVEVQFLTPLIESVSLKATKYSQAKLFLDDVLGSVIRKAKEITIQSVKEKELAAAAALAASLVKPEIIISQPEVEPNAESQPTEEN